MRNRFVVTYDICEPKRLRAVFKVMKGWGLHLQYSVFSCDLNPTELTLLKDELRAIIDFSEDKVLFVDVGPVLGRGTSVFESLGKEDELPAEPEAVIV